MSHSGNQRNASPIFLFADTSSLLPLGIGDCFPTIKKLESLYGVTTVISEKVEMELRWHVNNSPRFQSLKPALYKALNTGTLEVLDDNFADKWKLGANFMDDVEAEAHRFQTFGVDSGESYIHAAANALGMPALTNDARAVRFLERNGVQVPGVIRCFDVIAFAYQSSLLTETECDSVRSSLIRSGETIEKAFRHRSFNDGLGYFYLRLVDKDCQSIGNNAPINRHDSYRLKVVKKL